MGTDSTYDDLFDEGVYQLIRYGQLIGTDTIYRHIHNQEPDATYVYNHQNSPDVTYNNTVEPLDISGLTDADIIARFRDLNKMLVSESLEGADRIILPLSSGYDSRMLLAGAIEDEKIKSRLRCYTYTPNMSLETRPARELARIAGVSWEKVQLPVDSFSMTRLKQVLGIFGSTQHVHGKYQLDFLEEIKHGITPGRSVLMTGYITGSALGVSMLRTLNLCNGGMPLSEALCVSIINNYIPDDYLALHTRRLKPEMKYQAEPELKKMLDRCVGSEDARVLVFDIWTRLRNMYSYHARVLDWGVPHIAPHFTPELLEFLFAIPKYMMVKKRNAEMMMAKYYPALEKVASNSKLTVANILKRSAACPIDGFRHYLPLLIKYYFKQPWLLSKKMIAEMKDPVLPELKCIGQDGVYPIFDLNAESRDIFNSYFSWDEVNRLFAEAMGGSSLATKRLNILQAFAYGLKMLEK